MPPSNSASPAIAAAPLALTMGEPAGIGGEISLKAWAQREAAGLPPFFLLDNPARLAALAQRLGLVVPIREIAAPAEAASVFATALPVLPVAMPKAPEPGRPEPAATAAAIRAIEQATKLALSGDVGAIVTNPIAKAAAHAAGFRYPGHTEFIAALCKSEEPVMMLASPRLRVALVSIHVSLRDAIAGLDEERILRVGEITAEALRRDFGIAAPRLAVAGLNPHAGEQGAMGHEDAEAVAPAIARLCEEGIDARGPLPPDTMFHAAARATYDAAICMYHDQGLIPLKTLDFEQGVNITLGLPIIRTSPDHGTAFDIAGTGRADPQSLIAALKQADNMARHRAAFDAAQA